MYIYTLAYCIYISYNSQQYGQVQNNTRGKNTETEGTPARAPSTETNPPRIPRRVSLPITHSHYIYIYKYINIDIYTLFTCQRDVLIFPYTDNTPMGFRRDRFRLLCSYHLCVNLRVTLLTHIIHNFSCSLSLSPFI